MVALHNEELRRQDAELTRKVISGELFGRKKRKYDDVFESEPNSKIKLRRLEAKEEELRGREVFISGEDDINFGRMQQ